MVTEKVLPRDRAFLMYHYPVFLTAKTKLASLQQARDNLQVSASFVSAPPQLFCDKHEHGVVSSVGF